MAKLHRALSGRAIDPRHPALSSQARRLDLANAVGDARLTLPSHRDARGRMSLNSAPPITRTSMVAERWPLGFLSRFLASFLPRSFADDVRLKRAPADPEEPGADSPDPRGSWHRVAGIRRLAIAGLVLSQTYIAANFMSAVLPYHGAHALEIALLILFTILFAWVSVGFWTAIAGFMLLLIGRDRYAISRSAVADAVIDPAVRIAIIQGIATVRKAGKAAGTLTPDRLLAREYLDQGALFVAVGADTAILVKAARELAAQFTGASRGA